MTGKKIKEKVKLILLNIGFILLSFLTLIPILYAFSISISGSNSIISTEFHILPKTITMDNYITILTERPFGRWFVNSLLLSALTVLLTMLVAVPAAYVFSRMRFAGRKRTLYILLVLNAFPAILSMFAIYRIIKTLNLLNSYMGLVFMTMAGYNPEAAIGFWQRMASAGAQKIPEFMSTHPSDVSRINNIKKLIPEAMKYYKPGQTQLPGQSQKQTPGKSSNQQPYRFEKVTK